MSKENNLNQVAQLVSANDAIKLRRISMQLRRWIIRQALSNEPNKIEATITLRSAIVDNLRHIIYREGWWKYRLKYRIALRLLNWIR